MAIEVCDIPNLLIAGAGRSGTSCLSGLFSKGGWYQGDALFKGTDSNPKGFFENRVINDLNEAMMVLSAVNVMGAAPAQTLLCDYHPGQFWLAKLPESLACQAGSAIRQQIRLLVAKRPFCFKDPRFAFTAKVWLEESPDTRVLCVFRDPATTVESILKECRTAPYLRNFRISVTDAFAVWRLTYLRLLSLYRGQEYVYFIRYDDMFNKDKLDQLGTLIGAKLNQDFPERQFNRSKPAFSLDVETQMIYETLLSISANDFGADRKTKKVLIDDLNAKRLNMLANIPEGMNFGSKGARQPARLLAMEPVPQGINALEVCVEMLPLQHSDHLENFADHFGEGWFDSNSKKLRLKFQLVSLFKGSEIQGLRLAAAGAAEKVALSSQRVESPYVGQKHMDIVWSGKSRFVIDETVVLPDAFSSESQLDLLAEVGGTYRKIGTIHIALP